MTTFHRRQQWKSDREAALGLAAQDEAARLRASSDAWRSVRAELIGNAGPEWADTQPNPLAHLPGVDIDAVHRRTPSAQAWRNAFPACGGPCDQGRKLCPSPEACLRDDDSSARKRSPWGAVGVLLCVASAVGMSYGLAQLVRPVLRYLMP